MTSLKEFIRTFRDSGFDRRALTRFYHSVRKSVILRLMGKGSLPDLFSLEEKCLWPVLREIDDPGLPVYKGADRELLKAFIGTIGREKELRAQKAGMERLRYWTALRRVIEERTELFSVIFGFSGRDMRYCESVAERYAAMKDRRRRRRMWQIGIGAGAATLAGTVWYLSRKKKSNE